MSTSKGSNLASSRHTHLASHPDMAVIDKVTSGTCSEPMEPHVTTIFFPLARFIIAVFAHAARAPRIVVTLAHVVSDTGTRSETANP